MDADLVGLETTVTYIDDSVADESLEMCPVCENPNGNKKRSYGVISCRGCANFFHTVLIKLTKVIYCDKECDITGTQKDVLARCNYCKFKKCLKVGMQVV